MPTVNKTMKLRSVSSFANEANPGGVAQLIFTEDADSSALSMGAIPTVSSASLVLTELEAADFTIGTSYNVTVSTTPAE
jgi:hypothetical protein